MASMVNKRSEGVAELWLLFVAVKLAIVIYEGDVGSRAINREITRGSERRKKSALSMPRECAVWNSGRDDLASAFSSASPPRRKSDEIMVVGEREQCGVSIAEGTATTLQRRQKRMRRRNEGG